MTTPLTRPTVRTDPDLWVPQPDGSHLRISAPRTVGEVWQEIVATLPAYGVDLAAFDYAGPYAHAYHHQLFPQGYRWIACFAVRGVSEGWFVHVDIVRVMQVTTADGTLETVKVLEPLFLAKTFEGWDTVYALAHAVARMLNQ